MSNPIWLVGVGTMGLEYALVLVALKQNVVAIGRGEKRAQEFEEKTGISVVKGGVEDYLKTNSMIPERAIVSVGIEELRNVTLRLMRYGIKKILVEKPAGLNSQEIKEVHDFALKNSAEVYVAYNRRFYASVLKANEIIQEDGGLTSFHFEFTEWGNVVEALEKIPEIKKNWFLVNSSHVVDMAFFLGGGPKDLCSFTTGGLSWHPSASIFSGAGITHKGALFSYHANWQAPGRWGVEIMTQKHRLIFRPLEKLQVQKIGSLVIEEVMLNDQLDTHFKPGLYKQVESFLNDDTKHMCTIQEHWSNIGIYRKMGNYA